MTALNVGLAAAGSGLLIVWILNMVRHGRLYVGYGVALMAGIVFGCAALLLPGVLGGSAGQGGAVPFTTLALLGVLGAAFVLAYVFSQLTIVSNRVALVVQELAIERAGGRDGLGAGRAFQTADGRDTIGSTRPGG